LWPVAFIALVPWALQCSRPGRWAFAAEWLAAAIGISAICWWSTYVIWITLLAVALVPAVYMAVAGVLLRRIARRWPLAIAAPAAWIALETLRLIVEPPFGFGWMRLGHHAHAELWLAGSARVWGTAGIGFAMAAFAGGIADFLRARSRASKSGGEPIERPRPYFSRPWQIATAALAPLVLCVVFSAITSAPATKPGPRVLLVQPSFPQERKMSRVTGQEMLQELLSLTRRGMNAARRDNEPVDIVGWGETLMPYDLGSPDLVEQWQKGIRPVPWQSELLDLRYLENMRDAEKTIIAEFIYGANGYDAVLPPGTAFVSGAEHYVVRDGVFRRQNAVVAWDSSGRRTGVAAKLHLVPGGETMAGLEQWQWVRNLAFTMAGYVPDLVDFDRTQVLTVHGHDGRPWRFGATVCFDNMFEGPYVLPLQDGEVDFHFVASNEAWFRESWEYDQMMAFSHLVAIETGRSMVRATNAGITAVVGPDGRDVARLEVLGRDRMVSGSLRAVVPVPLDGSEATVGASTPESGTSPTAKPAPRPFYVATWRFWISLWIAIGVVLSIRVRRAPVTAPE
jgi:apolipoprotein N-acyltransferase